MAAPCPCTSGLPYPSCCAPYHRGDRPPPGDGRLVRSRFSAFAMKDVRYLWRTLHPAHPDRSRSRDEVLADLRASCSSVRYRALQLLEERPPAAPGEPSQVLFLAKIFVKGTDRSFIELSDFLPDEGEAYGYVGGVGVPASSLPLKGLTIEKFTQLVPENRADEG